MDNIPQDQDNEADLAAIDAVIAAFFGAFTNKHGAADPGRLRALTIAQCVIVKASAPEIYGLEDFIAPRAKLLNGGPLTEFEEVETSSSTDIFGNIAQRLSLYRKSGILSGDRFAATGVNQFCWCASMPAGRLLPSPGTTNAKASCHPGTSQWPGIQWYTIDIALSGSSNTIKKPTATSPS